MTEIRCPYHGFTWHTNGKLKHIPGMWDFPAPRCAQDEPARSEGRAVERLRVHQHGSGLRTFETYIGEPYRHWDRYPLGERYTAVHVAKVMRSTGRRRRKRSWMPITSSPRIPRCWQRG